jgi:hypothetical protein
MWIFFIFRSSKIYVSSIGIVSSLSPPRCHLSSGRRHAAAPCHTSFSLSQDELIASALFSGNALSRRLPSRAKTEALNPHIRRRLPSLDQPTPTLHFYKKIIWTLGTHPTTQPHLYFCLLASQSTTPSELHSPSPFSFTVVSHPSSLRTTTSQCSILYAPVFYNPARCCDISKYLFTWIHTSISCSGNERGSTRHHRRCRCAEG